MDDQILNRFRESVLKENKELIETMDADGVDRSDMIVILGSLFRDANFRMTFLPRR